MVSTVAQRPISFVAVILLALLADASSHAADEDQLALGKKIYEASCAKCHGASGQGVAEEYADPLVGDSSLGELTDVISDTMPEESPESCVGANAQAVAAYIHDAFYSPAAQLRNRPPRTALSRLTANQLQQSLADLYEIFGGDAYVVSERGLEAKYVNHNRYDRNKIKIERIDPQLNFDFGDQGPGSDIDPKQFFIQWAGSLKVDHSGRYEIILRSTCSCMMHFGDLEREFVNNHVQSAGKEEFRVTLNLIAGRLYPLKLTFTQRKRKTKQPPAKVSLSWVPPNGVEEIIPEAFLVPKWMPGTFALQTKLPADDRSYGYERGTAVDRGWDESTTRAALEFAQVAVDELYPRYRRRHENDSNENRGVLRGFLKQVVEAAFRGPIDEATQQVFIDRQLEQSPDDGEAIKRCLVLALKSPRFLYPVLDSDRSVSQRVANRMALTLYDSLPSDRWITQAVEGNRLETDQQIVNAARRMIGDYRGRAKIRGMIYHWLDLDNLTELTKDGDRYPGFDPALVSDLRLSLDNFIDHVIEQEASDFRQLLTADWSFTSDRMESFYGDRWKLTDTTTGGFAMTPKDGQQHAGVIGHPLVLSKLAYHAESSPIHRGVFLIRHVLGRTLRPPNEAFTPINPDLHPSLTTRQRVEQQTNEKSCQVCHQKINALGFALESFDAAGRFREQDRGQEIDVSGYYISGDGKESRFSGLREMVEFLAQSQECHESFVETAFEYYVKQPIAAYGSDKRAELTKQFRQDNYNVRKLIERIAVIAARDPSN